MLKNSVTRINLILFIIATYGFHNFVKVKFEAKLTLN